MTNTNQTETARRVIATLRPGLYQPTPGLPCWHTVRDAAAALGVSESTVRRAAHHAGAPRIAGRTVSGMVELHIAGHGRRGCLPYAE